MSVVAVIGLGYVGLPLVVEFGKHVRTIGFDIAVPKVESCLRGVDPSRELADEEMRLAVHAQYTADPAMLAEADIIIVAVPTPVDEAHIPDFKPLIGSSTSVGRHMKKGAIVVYESTVYPGATEEVCIPVLERESGLKWKQDFFVGYSPERINPGDKEHTLTKILKIVSGDTPETLEKVAALYENIIVPGVHRAAGTKWNFLRFKPGLVGGHCIGVDPYYLTHKADMLGYHPQVILAGRRINDSMGKFIAEQTIKHMIASGSYIKGAKVNVLGLTFKENCGDLRNSKVIDIIHELQTYGVEIYVTDPQAEPEEAMHEYGVKLTPWADLPRADAIVAAVAHKEYAALGAEDMSKKLVKGGAFIDVKSAFDRASIEALGHKVWRL